MVWRFVAGILVLGHLCFPPICSVISVPHFSYTPHNHTLYYNKTLQGLGWLNLPKLCKLPFPIVFVNNVVVSSLECPSIATVNNLPSFLWWVIGLDGHHHVRIRDHSHRLTLVVVQRGIVGYIHVNLELTSLGLVHHGDRQRRRATR